VPMPFGHAMRWRSLRFALTRSAPYCPTARSAVAPTLGGGEAFLPETPRQYTGDRSFVPARDGFSHVGLSNQDKELIKFSILMRRH
jgi:hypothetical protein